MSQGSALLLLVPLLVCCAQVRDITGGEKDDQAPVLIAARPPGGSTHFAGNTIQLTFDERITLDRVRDRMLVSPPLDAQPEVRVTGARNVTIELKAPLLPNTTYSFGIGEAVKDLTEGNIASGLVHVVSTGDVLDSLFIAGTVSNAFTGQPEENVLVMVYDVNDTMTIRNGRPAYATRSDVRGSFLLAHLRAGRYRLLALRDQNANYRYDLPNEEVAFADEVIALTDTGATVVAHHLRLFQEPGREQSIREARVIADGALRLVLAQRGRTVTIEDMARTGGRLEWRSEWSSARDTVLLWPSDTTALTLGRYAVAVDGIPLDTLRYRPSERMPFHIALIASVREVGEGAHVVLKASRPVVAIDEKRITVLRDSVPLPFTVQRDTLDHRTLLLYTDLPPGASARLVLLPKAIRDQYNGYNDTLSLGIGRAADRNTGDLRVRMDVASHRQGPFILQLLDARQHVVREARLVELGQEAVFDRLTPGDHRLRLVQDTNGNGRWDSGRLDDGVQPEMVWQHADRVNVRAAWDLTIDWTLP